MNPYIFLRAGTQITAAVLCPPQVEKCFIICPRWMISLFCLLLGGGLALTAVQTSKQQPNIENLILIHFSTKKVKWNLLQ